MSAAAICFHAAHEGHPFVLTYKDYEVISPCALGERFVSERERQKRIEAKNGK